MNGKMSSEFHSLFKEFPELSGKKISFQKDNNSINEIIISELDFPYDKPFSNPIHKISVAKSSISGYGVFANENIRKKQVIEISKLVKLNLRKSVFTDPVFKDYYYSPNHCSCNDCKNHGQPIFIGLGYLSLYNHSVKSNAFIIADFKNLTMTVKSKKSIAKGEEIFITYGEDYFKNREINQKLNAEILRKLG